MRRPHQATGAINCNETQNISGRRFLRRQPDHRFCYFAERSSTESVRARAKPLIGLSMDTLKEERWQGDRDLFVTRARELGADVLVQSANSDDTRQISDVQALISRRVDVLVIVPHNGGAMAKTLNIAHDAGIPVLAYDRPITDCDLH